MRGSDPVWRGAPLGLHQRSEPVRVRGSANGDTATGLGQVILVSGSRYEVQGFDGQQTGRRSADQPGVATAQGGDE